MEKSEIGFILNLLWVPIGAILVFVTQNIVFGIIMFLVFPSVVGVYLLIMSPKEAKQEREALKKYVNKIEYENNMKIYNLMKKERLEREQKNE